MAVIHEKQKHKLALLQIHMGTERGSLKIGKAGQI